MVASRLRRLLLATEHGEFDAGSEALAFEFTRRFGCPLAAVLPRVSNPEFEAVAPQQAAQADGEAAAQHTELQRAAQAAGVGLRVGAPHGLEPHADIADEAPAATADLLDEGRHRGSAIAGAGAGDTAQRVVGLSQGPVLVHVDASSSQSESP